MSANSPSEVHIWSEERGPERGRPTLLIAGTGNAATIWPPSLIESLVSQRRRVIVFDHRDTGRSSMTPDDSTYALNDLAADAGHVLDQHGAAAATVVGYSMGAAAAQMLAIARPDLVERLVLVGGLARPDAGYEPGPAVAGMFALDFNDPVALARWFAETLRSDGATEEELDRLASSVPPVLTGRSVLRHVMAQLTASPPTDAELAGLDVVCDVIHGDADRSVPLSNGERVARDIPGARLHIVPGAGHTLTRPVCDAICAVLADADVRA